ncbi:antitoxin [Salinibacterium sp.]|uniref:antitoxin n=1 Tax=Salinibacterium sp. TaxID=1915057 RepID=UPI00286D381A|nr:antitoxin [Salinibacterium sp.]
MPLGTLSDEENIMGLEDITGKAQEFLNDNKVKDALNSQQAEDISDKLLDGVAGVADKITGGKFAEQIDGARDAADGAVGTEK